MGKIVLTVGWIIVVMPFNSAAQTLIIGQLADSQAATVRHCQTMVSHIYAELNIPIKMVSYPGRRSLYLANKGETDGELCRIGSIVREYPNLVAVQPHLMVIRLFAISKDGTLSIKKPTDLRGLKLISIRGVKAVENYFQGYDLEYVADSSLALRVLQTGRVDVAIIAMIEFERLDPHLKIHRPALSEHKVYHYLHKRQKALLGPLGTQIRRLKSAEKERK